MNQERASQLEAALEQARSQTWSLERTVQQLHEQVSASATNIISDLKSLHSKVRYKSPITLELPHAHVLSSLRSLHQKSLLCC